MLLEYWTAHYAAEAASGASTYEAEDPEFDLDAIEAALDRDDDWEPATARSSPP